jgi:hypothetical protein
MLDVEVVMQTIANLAIVLGSVGMIYFAVNFPFSTHLWELKDDQKAHRSASSSGVRSPFSL